MLIFIDSQVRPRYGLGLSLIDYVEELHDSVNSYLVMIKGRHQRQGNGNSNRGIRRRNERGLLTRRLCMCCDPST
jgi:hypothetical protein